MVWLTYGPLAAESGWSTLLCCDLRNQWLGPGHGAAVFLLLLFRLGRVGPGAGCRLTVGGGVDTTMLACLVFVVCLPAALLVVRAPAGCHFLSVTVGVGVALLACLAFVVAFPPLCLPFGRWQGVVSTAKLLR